MGCFSITISQFLYTPIFDHFAISPSLIMFTIRLISDFFASTHIHSHPNLSIHPTRAYPTKNTFPHPVPLLLIPVPSRAPWREPPICIWSPRYLHLSLSLSSFRLSMPGTRVSSIPPSMRYTCSPNRISLPGDFDSF